METMSEQAEQSGNDWLALISRLKNTCADTAKGDRPVQVWHGVDWPSLMAEMNEMKSRRHIRGVSVLKHGLQNFSVSLSFPRSTFRNTGEQIDGSFRLNDDFYLLEAKWHQNRTPAADLHVFEGKLSTKAKWARACSSAGWGLLMKD